VTEQAGATERLRLPRKPGRGIDPAAAVAARLSTPGRASDRHEVSLEKLLSFRFRKT
jgi:hypothetical protein